MEPSIELSSEKYLKRLAGRTDMDDALKRLDKLTHEEAWMAVAQNLKVTHAVGQVVEDIDARVANIDEAVQGVNDTVAVIIDGAQTILSWSSKFD